MTSDYEKVDFVPGAVLVAAISLGGAMVAMFTNLVTQNTISNSCDFAGKFAASNGHVYECKRMDGPHD